MDIVLERKRDRFGSIKGMIKDDRNKFQFMAIATKAEIEGAEYAHIKEFKLFTDERVEDGIRRKIYAEYKNKDWSLYNYTYSRYTDFVIEYLDRRASIKLVA